MLIAIDCATETLGLALHDGARVLAEYTWSGKEHATAKLAPAVKDMLGQAGAMPKDLTAVGVAIGPGSYTGLRIGLALAKGLALAQQLPIVGIPTADILARAQPASKEPMLVLIAAGRGRVAGVWYKWTAKDWVARSEAEGMTFAEVLASLSGATYICGELGADGRRVLESDSRVRLASPALSLRRPGFLAELAWEKIHSRKLADPAMIAPVYLRAKA